MKRILLLSALVIMSLLTANAQGFADKLHYKVEIGAAYPLPESDKVPIQLTAEMSYAFIPRLFVCLGTGIKQIEKTLLPLYAGLRWNITQSDHAALFIDGQYGYSFALSPGSSGGNHWGGFFGCDFPLKSKNSIALSLGYEYQGYRVLRSSHAASFDAEFIENIGHNSLCLKLAYCF